MAKASQENTKLDTRTRIDLVKWIFRLIEDNSLAKIKQVFEAFQREQRIKITNSAINGFIPLYVAINHNNVKMSRYLLEVSLLQGRREMPETWKHCRHPLIAAINVGNSELIVLVLQHLSHIKDKISGPLTPLMLAVFSGKLTAVKLIVAMGADINQRCLYGRIPLMESTSKSDICSFLISQGANVNYRGKEGFTALHIAASLNHKESVDHLVNAGADITIRSREGITPLIWAAINLNHELVIEFGHQPGYSESDRIEALEILNAGYVCAQKSDIEIWAGALDARRRGNLPKNGQVPVQELLDCSQEFTSVTELEVLQGDPLRLAYQSILVVERVLGKNNRIYIQFILQTALIAKQGNKKKKVRQLIDHIQHYCEEASFVAANLLQFTNVFRAIAESNNFFECGMFTIFKIIAKAAIKMWFLVKDLLYMYPNIVDHFYSDLVDTFLYMTSTTNSLIVSAQQYLVEFREEVKRVLNKDLRHQHLQSILHRAVNLMADKPWASVELIMVLLESGADVTSKDKFGRTPVTYVLEYMPENKRSVVLELFEEYRCHPDC